jgi:hypothetical protein
MLCGACMLTMDTVFERELKKIVALRIADLKDSLASNNYTEVSDFRYLMGKIAAFKDLDDMMAEAHEAADQRNR